MYKAIVKFADRQDGGRVYQIGDTFPRSGLEVSEDRFEELATAQNVRGFPLIEKIIEEEQKPVEKPKRGRRKVKADA